jgi:hypothetical protein
MRGTRSKLAIVRASTPKIAALAVASRRVPSAAPDVLLACWARPRANCVPGAGGAAAGWLGDRLGVMTGNRLDAFPAGASTVLDSATGDGTGPRAGGAIETAAGGVVAAAVGDREGADGLALVAVLAGTTVTVAAAVAGVIGGVVVAAAAAVSVTCAAPADGVWICASRV